MIDRLMKKDRLRLVKTEEAPEADPVATARANLAINVDNATVSYPIRPMGRGSLKSAMMSAVGGKGESRVRTRFVDAVRNVSFKISTGERVALVGHNGSGKSTLLRSLAGIYPLATGSMTVMGKIGTLLDLGLGFEPESTGRENIYYRGMTMGYSRAQLKKVEREIVEFTDIGEFIDMPMRTYSAGMQVRLGFAVSTIFSPDILLVDEVFGAGDATFAKKAMARMMEIVDNAGIFVMATHDTQTLQRLCNRVLWLHQGNIVADGPTEEVIPQYLAYMNGPAE